MNNKISSKGNEMLVSFSLSFSFSPVLVFLISRFYSSHIVKTERDIKSRSTNSSEKLCNY